MNYQSKEMLLLKKQYDIDYLQYWRRPDGTSKYSTISMDEFKARLKLTPPKYRSIERLNKDINYNTINNEAELLLLKKQYDIDYLQHWRRPDGTSKYNTISVDEFKARLMLIPPKYRSIERLNNEIGFNSNDWATREYYCDECGAQFYRSPNNSVIAGFGFCDNCCVE